MCKFLIIRGKKKKMPEESKNLNTKPLILDLKLRCEMNSGFVTKERVTGRKDRTLRKEVIRED